jgi:hypothetical protein
MMKRLEKGKTMGDRYDRSHEVLVDCCCIRKYCPTLDSDGRDAEGEDSCALLEPPVIMFDQDCLPRARFLRDMRLVVWKV